MATTGDHETYRKAQSGRWRVSVVRGRHRGRRVWIVGWTEDGQRRRRYEDSQDSAEAFAESLRLERGADAEGLFRRMLHCHMYCTAQYKVEISPRHRRVSLHEEIKTSP